MDRREQWQAIMGLTARMHSQAAEGDWLEVAELEGRRRQSLETFFAHGVDLVDAEFVANGIRALMALDKEIMERGGAARDEVAQQLGQMQQGRRAQVAYEQNR